MNKALKFQKNLTVVVYLKISEKALVFRGELQFTEELQGMSWPSRLLIHAFLV